MKRFRFACLLLAALVGVALCGSCAADRALAALDRTLERAQTDGQRADWVGAGQCIRDAQTEFARQEVFLQKFARRDLVAAAQAELAGLEHMADPDSADDFALGVARARHHLAFLRSLFGLSFS